MIKVKHVKKPACPWSCITINNNSERKKSFVLYKAGVPKTKKIP